MNSKIYKSDRLKALKDKAEKLINENFVDGKSNDELINELLTYQTELELQHEELLAAQENASVEKEKYSILFSEAPVGYTVVDTKGVIRNNNREFSKITNTAQSSILDKPFVIFVSTKDHQIFFQKLNLASRNLSAEDFEIEIKSKNNNNKWCSCKLKPLFVNNGEQLFLLTVTDVTQIIDLQKKLQSQNEKLGTLNIFLETRIKEETEKRLKNEHILFEQQKFADMGQMINSIAHQWRQPINALGLIIQNIYSEVEECGLSEDILELEKTAMQLIDHMSKTIDDFRHFFDSKKDSILFNITDALVSSITLFNARLIDTNITFRFSCKCEESFLDLKNKDCLNVKCKQLINGRNSEFKQVFLNIIQNSIDAIQEKKKEGIIETDITFEKNHVTIAIEDSGGGIKQEAIGKLFEPYYTTKDEGKGTGIGLYMSRVIIEEHMKGKISVINTSTGARFLIMLPYPEKK